jgi:hypothetical protein
VECPGKLHVLSGTTSVSGPFAAGSTTVGVPFDGDDSDKTEDDGWISQARNSSESKLGFTGEAICSKIKPSYKVAKRSVPANEQASYGIECKSGQVGIAGGAVGNGLTSNSGYPTSFGWTMFLDNLLHADRKATIGAICVTPETVDTSESGSSSLPGLTPAQGGTGCGSGLNAIGGGQSNSGTYAEMRTRSLSIGTTGISYAIDNVSSDTEQYKIYLVCAGHLP